VKRRIVATRRLAWSGAAGAVAVALLATFGVTSQASAEVNPYDADARFISLGKKGQCGTLGYTAEGYMIDSSGEKIPNSTWHNWDGTLRGCLSSFAVFAWEPASSSAEVLLKVYAGDTFLFSVEVPGDKNFCTYLDSEGDWNDHWSSEGGGGSGQCTAS
jgi:hypothetical protein